MGKKDPQNNQQNNLSSDFYCKQNIFINAKYRASLMENKILALAFANINNIQKLEDGSYASIFSPSELRKLLGKKNDKNLYTELDETAKHMTAGGTTIGVSNPEKRTFDYIALVIRATYDKNFIIRWNPAIIKLKDTIEGHYTMLCLPAMLSFKSVYSLRIYELLKSARDYKKSLDKKLYKKELNEYKIEVGLSEFKLQLGIVNANDEKIKKLLLGKNINYDNAVEKADQKDYERWDNFKRCVLEKAKKEINTKIDTGLYIDYEVVRAGKGGKISGLIFTIKDRPFEKGVDIIEETNKIEPNNIVQIIEKANGVKALIKEDITVDDAYSILEAADYDLDKVQEAYEVAKVSGDITNIVGWMIKAIKEGYKMPKGKKKQNTYDSFMQNEYDFDQLEKDLVENI